MGKTEIDFETLASLILKIEVIDPGIAGYLKRHIKLDKTSNSLVYTGNPLILERVSHWVKISD